MPGVLGWHIQATLVSGARIMEVVVGVDRRCCVETRFGYRFGLYESALHEKRGKSPESGG